MWKNIFIEALLLSVIIFGGFYINATLMTREISVKHENILNEHNTDMARLHFSGFRFENGSNLNLGTLSGSKTSHEDRSSVSGFPLFPTKVSGNNA